MPAVELCGGFSSVSAAHVLIRPRSSLGSTGGYVENENQAIVYKKINHIGFDCLLDFSNKFHNNCQSNKGRGTIGPFIRGKIRRELSV